mmetsp:Transcript_45871/g.146483  ORF Transcript_45871/g.146483 Transcript_45871/m.146483 type:complete len:279 (+) Transcript_45871:563-1399(+)
MELLEEVEARHRAVEPKLCELLRIGPELAHLLPLLLHVLVLPCQLPNLPLQLLDGVDVFKLEEHGEEADLSNQRHGKCHEAFEGGAAEPGSCRCRCRVARLHAGHQMQDLQREQEAADGEAAHKPEMLPGEHHEAAAAETALLGEVVIALAVAAQPEAVAHAQGEPGDPGLCACHLLVAHRCRPVVTDRRERKCQAPELVPVLAEHLGVLVALDADESDLRHPEALEAQVCNLDDAGATVELLGGDDTLGALDGVDGAFLENVQPIHAESPELLQQLV